MIVYRELSTLEQDLEIRAETLYAVSNSLPRHYRAVRIPKGGGADRRLSVPDDVLKHIQRRITERLLVHMPISPHATAYRYGGGIGKNAAPHAGRPVLLKLDIERFFDSVLYSAVKDCAFPAEIYAEPLRVLLTLLCYYRDALPQGAPSSPAISNLILRAFDDAVGTWCTPRGIVYTRYCDDLSFSGDFDPREVFRFVRDRLREHGFFLNAGKTSWTRDGRRQTVTGLVVNERVQTPASYRRQLRQALYYCQKFGVQEHLARTGQAGGDGQAYLASLLGRVSHALFFSPKDTALQFGRDWIIAQMRVQACGLEYTQGP